MSTVAEVFGTALRRTRTQRGMTQKELGAITGMSHTFIGEMERGLKAPNLNAVIALARALNAGVDELLSGFIPKPAVPASPAPPSPPPACKRRASAHAFASIGRRALPHLAHTSAGILVRTCPERTKA